MDAAGGFRRTLASSAVLCFLYFLAIAGVTGDGWARYHSAGGANAAVTFSSLLLANSALFALLVLFPKPSHYRVVALALYLYHLAIGVLLLTAALTFAVLASFLGRFCIDCRRSSQSDYGNSTVIGVWFAMPGIVFIGLGLLFWWTASGNKLADDHNIESARARSAPPVWALVLLSVLSAGGLLMLILGGQLLRFNTSAEYVAMIQTFDAAVEAFNDPQTNLDGFKALTLTCTVMCPAFAQCTSATFAGFGLEEVPNKSVLMAIEGLSSIELPLWRSAGGFGVWNATAVSEWAGTPLIECDAKDATGLDPTFLHFNHSAALFRAHNATHYQLIRTRIPVPIAYDPLNRVWTYVGRSDAALTDALNAETVLPESEPLQAFPAALNGVISVEVVPALPYNLTRVTGVTDPRVQAQRIAGVEWGNYDGPSPGARKGRGAILLAFAAILFTALAVASHQLIWKRIAAAPAAPYAHVLPSLAATANDSGPDTVAPTPSRSGGSVDGSASVPERSTAELALEMSTTGDG